MMVHAMSRGVRGVRKLSSILPKLPFDRHEWPSTLASNKRVADGEKLDRKRPVKNRTRVYTFASLAVRCLGLCQRWCHRC